MLGRAARRVRDRAQHAGQATAQPASTPVGCFKQCSKHAPSIAGGARIADSPRAPTAGHRQHHLNKRKTKTMNLNQSYLIAAPRQSSARRPRGIVKINGTPVSFLSATVENKSHFSADTWRVKLEAWGQPEGFGMAYWADATDVQVEILFGDLADGDDVSAAPTNVTSVILGQVDDVEINPLDGAYAQLARSIPAWDLLVFLAQQEGFDCYVHGSTLYFGPPQADTDTTPTIITVSGGMGDGIQSNVARLKLRRSLTLAQNISVTVLSHNTWSGTLRGVATRIGKKPATSSASQAAERVQPYVVSIPGLSQAEADRTANSILLDITKFERTFEATMQGDPLLTVRRRAVIQGTQTSFDQSYYIQQISRTLDFEGGFAMSVAGKNHSTESNPEV